MAVVGKKKKTTTKQKKTLETKFTSDSQRVDEVVKLRDTLSPEDLLQLETISRDVENAKLLLNLEEQSLRNMLLEEALIKVNIEKQRQVVANRDQRYKLLNDRFTINKKEIWSSYGIGEKEGLGYDPKTGKIVRK